MHDSPYNSSLYFSRVTSIESRPQTLSSPLTRLYGVGIYFEHLVLSSPLMLIRRKSYLVRSLCEFTSHELPHTYIRIRSVHVTRLNHLVCPCYCVSHYYMYCALVYCALKAHFRADKGSFVCPLDRHFLETIPVKSSMSNGR